jgi:hypothetical protein
LHHLCLVLLMYLFMIICLCMLLLLRSHGHNCCRRVPLPRRSYWKSCPSTRWQTTLPVKHSTRWIFDFFICFSCLLRSCLVVLLLFYVRACVHAYAFV